ncbi:MAG: collagen-like triple helix repeat-containing protein [Ktedonobacterales bacterium]
MTGGIVVVDQGPAAVIKVNTGAPGPTGLTGPAGPQGNPGATGTTGAPGADGATGPAGATGPQGDPGATGSTGAAGAAGTNGATWREGPGVPSNGTGADGDFYLRTSTGDVYQRASGTYSIIANITGPAGATGATGAAGAPGSAGATGPAGADGTDGTNGSTWFEGSGAPSSGTGVDGDYYFRTDTGDVYTKSAGAWGSPIANIVGPQGPQGASGSAGSALSNSPSPLLALSLIDDPDDPTNYAGVQNSPSPLAPGAFGSATQHPAITTDRWGRVIAVTLQTVTPAWSSLTAIPPVLTTDNVPSLAHAWDNSANDEDPAIYVGLALNTAQQQLALAVAGLAPLASPALTGVPTVPTAAALTDNTQAASTAYVDSAVAAVTPSPLVTVTKPAALTAGFTVTTAMIGYIYLDPNGATRVVTLPAHAVGDWFVIRNISTGAFNLTVNDSGATLQATLAAGMTILFVDDGTTWRLH